MGSNWGYRQMVRVLRLKPVLQYLAFANWGTITRMMTLICYCWFMPCDRFFNPMIQHDAQAAIKLLMKICFFFGLSRFQGLVLDTAKYFWKVLDLAINKLSMNHLETSPKGCHAKSKVIITMRVYRYNQRRRKLAKKIKGEEKTDMVLFIWRRSLRFFKWFDWKFLLKLRCCGLVGLEMNSESVKNPLHSSKPFSEYNWTIGSMGTSRVLWSLLESTFMCNYSKHGHHCTC